MDWRIERSSVDKGGPLNYEIVWDIMTSAIMIADITDKNANVLYELGVRHALCAALGYFRTIMIMEESSFDLPFDFANYSVIKYDKNRPDTWKGQIRRRLLQCVSNYRYRDNPVSMTFAQQGLAWSLQANQQDVNLQWAQSLNTIEKMINMGFEIDWIQNMITQNAAPGPYGGSPVATQTWSEMWDYLGKFGEQDDEQSDS